jgi:hypothetical protein
MEEDNGWPVAADHVVKADVVEVELVRAEPRNTTDRPVLSRRHPSPTLRASPQVKKVRSAHRSGSAATESLVTETPNGVHVTTTESFAGEPVEADKQVMQTLLDASPIAWLGDLKTAAESRT